MATTLERVNDALRILTEKEYELDHITDEAVYTDRDVAECLSELPQLLTTVATHLKRLNDEKHFLLSAALAKKGLSQAELDRLNKNW